MRAVDTNVLVRLITRDDERQAQAAERFVAKGGAWVAHVVLAELAWVLGSVYELRRSEIAQAMELLLDQEQLVVQDPDVVSAAVAAYRAGGGRDFADCLIVEVARKAGHGPVGTFDRKLARLPGAVAV
jgi:predicted nucleic-acid-binding protein